ncbi:hypothetical protein PSM7751_01733 [Pseudooceanicola marinus]|uniref:Uncharacterized protein n=2 Tax=Pseudooceanicola marinus TaxID=396013 RepID=A0A1X6Z2C3_9RHOB|nr:hypothetical protein PSM7751_01733 [Pseudooceanicola marinus]
MRPTHAGVSGTRAQDSHFTPMTGRYSPLPARLSSPWRIAVSGMLIFVLLSRPIPTAQANPATSLLRPGAVSYAASGSYGLAARDNWAELSFGLFTPSVVTDRRGRFDALRFSLTGNRQDQTLRFSWGRAWRSVLPGGQVWGINSYLDLGAPPGRNRLMGQASLGVEYEQATSWALQGSRLRFGSNLYLPFADYASRQTLSGTNVPRAGLDGYLDWTRSLGTGLELGGRLSLFHYAATSERDARGIGTLSLKGRMTRYLPPGSALEARLGARYTPGEAAVPRLSMTYTRAIPHPGASASAPIGALRPASDCRIRPEAQGIERLDCGPTSYDPLTPYEVYGPGGRRPPVTVTVPTPERNLGYGTLFVP